MTDRVDIRPYGSDDLWLLERLLADPAQTAFVGGPESPEALRHRHARYLGSDPAQGGLFTVLVDGISPAGWPGYWERVWRDRDIWECGWNVLPEFQRRGVATAAMRLMIADARTKDPHRPLHAFPSVENAASNALCRRLGLRLLGEEEFEYPKGRSMRSNDWCLEAPARGGAGATPG